jgi:AraC-like DNA-binding protein
MKIIYPAPADSVSAYVQAILVIENDQVISPFALPLFANGTPTLLFSTAAGRIGNAVHHFMLFGQTVLPQQLLIPQSFKLIAYFLQPFALGPLFHITASELTDRPLALDLLAGTSGLQEQLLNTATTTELLGLMNAYLYGKIIAISHEDKRVIYAAKKVSGISDKSVLTTVQQELHMTERTFQRLFEQHIGVSPNQFRRINQFNRAFRQINESNYDDLGAVAHHNGYADQSHFIRAFKEFTDLTPSAFLRMRPPV